MTSCSGCSSFPHLHRVRAGRWSQRVRGSAPARYVQGRHRRDADAHGRYDRRAHEAPTVHVAAFRAPRADWSPADATASRREVSGGRPAEGLPLYRLNREIVPKPSGGSIWRSTPRCVICPVPRRTSGRRSVGAHPSPPNRSRALGGTPNARGAPRGRRSRNDLPSSRERRTNGSLERDASRTPHQALEPTAGTVPLRVALIPVG